MPEEGQRPHSVSESSPKTFGLMNEMQRSQSARPRRAAPTVQADQYRNHYQPLEFGMFGVLYNVAASVLFISLFKQLFLQKLALSLLSRSFHFLNLCLGYLGIVVMLALSFDDAVPKKRRLRFHIFLFAALSWFCGYIILTSEGLNVGGDLIKDQNLLLSIIVVTVFFWVILHILFRFLGKPNRWRKLGG